MCDLGSLGKMLRYMKGPLDNISCWQTKGIESIARLGQWDFSMNILLLNLRIWDATR